MQMVVKHPTTSRSANNRYLGGDPLRAGGLGSLFPVTRAFGSRRAVPADLHMGATQFSSAHMPLAPGRPDDRIRNGESEAGPVALVSCPMKTVEEL